MIRKYINTYISKNINKRSVAILFSGGVDSQTILFSCLDLKIKPTLYTFCLDNYTSEDMIYTRNIAKIFNLKLYEILIKTDDKESVEKEIKDIMARFKTSRKTKIQCIYPILKMLPYIKEDIILSGLCADDLYGSSRSVAKHYKDKNEFYNKRYLNDKDINSSSYFQIKTLIEDEGKKFIAPYKECEELRKYLLSKNFYELHKPKQKQVAIDDYPEILQFNLYRRNSNLQCNSKVRDWQDKLFLNDNIYGYKNISGIYNRMYLECISDSVKSYEIDNNLLLKLEEEFKIKLTKNKINKIIQIRNGVI